MFPPCFSVLPTEYAYGGHPYSYTGVYDTDPKMAAEVAGEGLRFKETVLVGTTVMSLEEVREVIQRLGKQYNGNAYHILNRCVPSSVEDNAASVIML